jgi:putative Ca2+/H+ antiporter (TMEM165/GDT1 family)
MLAARYHALVWVTAGTTLGMMLANVPAVLFGDKAVRFVPLVWVRVTAAVVFGVLGMLVLWGVGQ